MRASAPPDGHPPIRPHRMPVLLAGLALIVPLAQAQTDDPPAEKPCRQQSEKRRLPSSGLGFVYTKSFDCETGLISSRVVDEYGSEVDLAKLLEIEAEARQNDPRARISRDLRRAIGRDPDKQHRVMVWLKLDAKPMDEFAASLLDPIAPALGEKPTFSEQEILGIESRIVSNNETHIAAVISPFLKLVGNRAFVAATHAPAVGIVANGREIRALAERPEVDTLYLEGDGEDLNRNALYAHRVLAEWENSAFGEGRRIAILEKEPLEDHLFLNVVEYFRPGDLFIDSGHAQAVAGSIGSLILTRLGSAPLASLFSANTGNYTDGAVTPAADWVVDRRMDVTNLSWGGLEYDREVKYRDRLFDHHARYNLQSFVAAAGNAALNDNVASPALAWNVVAVGAINTGPDPDPDPSDWSNDVMSASSWVNPQTRVEKPNVAARGTNIKTVGLARLGYVPLIDYTGTSNAAPFVSATIALAMNRNPTLLPSPEAAMATIMASAWNNVEGPDDVPVSSQDGAGGIHTSAAARVAANFRVSYRILTSSAIGDRGYVPVTVRLRGGERTRIAIAWSAAASSLEYTLPWLQTDFDLVVFEGTGATGRWNAVSWSRFNNFELVDFVPRRTGWHTIAISAPRFTPRAPERLGLAISQYNIDVAAPVGP